MAARPMLDIHACVTMNDTHTHHQQTQLMPHLFHCSYHTHQNMKTSTTKPQFAFYAEHTLLGTYRQIVLETYRQIYPYSTRNIQTDSTRDIETDIPGQYPRRSVCALADMGPDVHNQQQRNFSVLFSTGNWTIRTHTYTQPFNGSFSGTTRVGRYQKKHSPTHNHPDHQIYFINFLHLLRSIASSLFNLHAWQSFLTTSLQVLFGLPLGLGPSTSYYMHFFTQSSSSFRSTCPY